MDRETIPFNPIQDVRGFTLVEIVIAIGIGSVLVFGMMQATSFTQKAVKSVGLSGDWSNLTSELRLVLNTPAACQQALAGTQIVISPSQPLAVTAPVALERIALASGTIAERGQPVIGLQVQELNLTVDPSTMIAKLSVRAQKKVAGKERAVGNSDFAQDFRFAVKLDPVTNKIVGCSGELSAPGVCGELGGVYDTTQSPPCRLPGYLHACHEAGATACTKDELAVGSLCCKQ